VTARGKPNALSRLERAYRRYRLFFVRNNREKTSIGV
jgi:hypothetical protein